MSFRATVLTLYPEMFPGSLGHSLAGKALDAGAWSLETVQIRDFAADRHRTVDDTPAGGGFQQILQRGRRGGVNPTAAVRNATSEDLLLHACTVRFLPVVTAGRPSSNGTA